MYLSIILNRVVAVAFIIIWLCIGLYFGTGSYSNIQNRIDKKDADKAWQTIDTSKTTKYEIALKKAALDDARENEKAILNLYPFISKFPNALISLITVFAFGILGSIINLLKQIVLEDKKPTDLKFVAEPLLGMLTGFVIIGLSILVPNTLATSDVELKPMSLMFLSLFSGFFSKRFYVFLSDLFDRIFKKNTDAKQEVKQ